MRRHDWVLFFALFCCFKLLNATSFVFVHIGPDLPPYLIDALGQVRLFNPTKPVYVLANNRALKKRSPLYDQLRVRFVPIESFPQSPEHKKFLNVCWMKKNVRTGFWVTTSERFLVLYDWMKHFKKKHIIHLENDTLLYANIDELMPIFKKHYHGLAVVMDEDERCIPCFMYLANAQIMNKLAHFFVEDLKTRPVTEIWQVNDMQIIAHFFRSHGSNDVDNLPIILPSYVKRYGLKNTQGVFPHNPKSYYNKIQLFNSIFDGAALGQFLGGTPHGQLPGFVNETTVFDPSKLQFIWKEDCEGRKVPYVRCGGNYVRINNLHIHSKQLWQFLSNNTMINALHFDDHVTGYNQTVAHF